LLLSTDWNENYIPIEANKFFYLMWKIQKVSLQNEIIEAYPESTFPSIGTMGLHGLHKNYYVAFWDFNKYNSIWKGNSLSMG